MLKRDCFLSIVPTEPLFSWVKFRNFKSSLWVKKGGKWIDVLGSRHISDFLVLPSTASLMKSPDSSPRLLTWVKLFDFPAALSVGGCKATLEINIFTGESNSSSCLSPPPVQSSNSPSFSMRVDWGGFDEFTF